MASKAELEEELAIVEAERDAAQKQAHDYAVEIDSLRGRIERVETKAKEMGLELALVPSTPAEAERMELDNIRAGVNDDLQALAELRNPPALPDGPIETPIEIVRANQRERAELQQRMATANTTLSRIASALRFDRWDEAADKIVDRVNYFVTLERRIEKKISELRKTSGPAAGVAAPFWISALQWVLSAPPPAVDFGKPRIINFVVNGHDWPIDAQPEHTLKHLLGIALVRAQCTFKPADEWLLYAEDGARVSADTIAREYKSASIVATLPIGYGA